MLGINITKFSSITTHYYCRFYNIYDINVFDNLRSNYSDLYGYIENGMAENQEKVLPDFKTNNEKDLMEKAAKMINNFCDTKETIWFVCYDGKYSNSRTEFINEINK